jgi:hypothetical protein
VDEEAYTFKAKTYLIFSWLDPRAPAALKEGTDEMIENNGTCAKPCSGQRMLEGDPTAGNCCTKVWAPSALCEFCFFLFETRRPLHPLCPSLPHHAPPHKNRQSATSWNSRRDARRLTSSW